MPEMIYVDSSNIEAIGYDEIAQELHVHFLSGAMYAYHSVSREIYDAIMNGPLQRALLHGSGRR